MEMFYFFLADINEQPGFYYIDKGIALGIAIVQAIIITLITNILLNRLLRKQQKIGVSLSKYGIDKVSASKKGLLGNSSKILFGLSGHQKPKMVKLCFITGFNFIKDFQLELEELVKNGTVVKILLGSTEKGHFNSVYESNVKLENIKGYSDDLAEYYIHFLFNNKSSENFLENSFLMLEYNKCIKSIKEPFNNSKEYQKKFKEQLKRNIEIYGDHIFQIYFVKSIINDINTKYNNKQNSTYGKIYLAHYIDEYRMPMIIAEYDYLNKKNQTRTLLWTNINAPIVETHESINIFCQEDESESKPYITDVVNSFDYLWQKYFVDTD